MEFFDQMEEHILRMKAVVAILGGMLVAVIGVTIALLLQRLG